MEKAYAFGEAHNKEKSEKALAATGATVTEVEIGGVTVEDIRPKGWTDNGKVLVYVHGGGWTLFSARTMFADAAPMAAATGLRVVSVNYTPAPRAHFEQIQGGLDDPRASPLNAELSKGFSPVLIVVGTKELLLSSSVRFYQALQSAGQSAKLDVYEGMWHVFPQYVVYGLPEPKGRGREIGQVYQRPPELIGEGLEIPLPPIMHVKLAPRASP